MIKVGRVILLILSIFILAGCNGSHNNDEEATVIPTAVAEVEMPTATATLEPTETATNTAVPTNTLILLTTNVPTATRISSPTNEPAFTPLSCPSPDIEDSIAAFESFESFQTQIDILANGSLLLNMNVAQRPQDQALDATIISPQETFNIIFLDGTAYAKTKDEDWTIFEGPSAENMVKNILSNQLIDEDLVRQLSNPECLGNNEILRELATYHYRYTNIDTNSVPGIVQSTPEDSEILNFVVDIWITTEEEGSYLWQVNLHIEFDGIGEQDFRTEISNVNAPLTIEAPEITSKPSFFAGIPHLNDAEILLESQDIIVYTTTATPEEVIEFYEMNLTNVGWEFQGTELLEQDGITMTGYNYTLEENELVFGAIDADNGLTLVSIAGGEKDSQ